MGVPSDKIALVPYGAAVTESPTKDVVEEARWLTGCAPLRLLWVGQLAYRKGAHHLFAALRRFSPSQVQLSSGDARRGARRASGADASQCHRLSFRVGSGARQMYRTHHLFVLPSMVEGFGLVYLEALAEGLPILCTPNTGGADLICDGVEGFVVDAGESDAIAERIELCLRDPGLLPKMSGGGAPYGRHVDMAEIPTQHPSVPRRIRTLPFRTQGELRAITMSTSQILLTHSVIVAGLLLFWMWRLRRRDLFHWRSAGFWAWAAFLLYYVLNPLGSLLTDELLRYDLALAIAGGEQRALRIGLVACVGISVFFLVYLRTRTRPITWGLAPSSQLTPLVWFFLLACIAVALPSLVIYRAGAFGGTENVVIEQGRFTGEVTGYQYSGHMLLLTPALFLILSKSIPGRVLGWLLLAAYVLLQRVGSVGPLSRGLDASCGIAN